MESKIINYNHQYFKKAFTSKIYTSSIYHYLERKKVKESVFNGTINPSDYDNK